MAAAYEFKLGAQLEQPDVAAKLNRELSANRQAMRVKARPDDVRRQPERQLATFCNNGIMRASNCAGTGEALNSGN